MNDLKISPDFTIEDIHKIREYDEERRMSMTKEQFREEVHADSLYMQKRIRELHPKKLIVGM
jgi:hypothetical protein